MTTTEDVYQNNTAVQVILKAGERIDAIIKDITEAGTIDRRTAVSTEHYYPGILPTHANGYSELPSQINYDITLESFKKKAVNVLKTAWEAIVRAIVGILNYVKEKLALIRKYFSSAKKHETAVDIFQKNITEALSEFPADVRSRAQAVIDSSRLALGEIIAQESDLGSRLQTQFALEVAKLGPIVKFCESANAIFPTYYETVRRRTDNFKRLAGVYESGRSTTEQLIEDLQKPSVRIGSFDNYADKISAVSGVEFKPESDSYAYMYKSLAAYMSTLSANRYPDETHQYETLLVRLIPDIKLTIDDSTVNTLLRAMSSQESLFKNFEHIDHELRAAFRSGGKRIWEDYTGIMAFKDVMVKYAEMRSLIYRFRHRYQSLLFDAVNDAVKDNEAAKLICLRYRESIRKSLKEIK